MRNGIRNGLIALTVAGAGIGGYLIGHYSSENAQQPDIAIRANDFNVDLSFNPTPNGEYLSKSVIKYPDFKIKFYLDVRGSLVESTNPQLARVYEIMRQIYDSNKVSIVNATNKDPTYPERLLENLIIQAKEAASSFDQPLNPK